MCLVEGMLYCGRSGWLKDSLARTALGAPNLCPTTISQVHTSRS